MRYSLSLFALIATSLWLTAPVSAQTLANITYSSQQQGGSLITNTYTGSGGVITLGTPSNPSLDLSHSGSASGDGSAGNAIIVTPVSDPVIRFDLDLWNTGTSPLKEVTFQLPVDPAHPRQLGYLDPGYITEGFGTGSYGGKNFLFQFLNPTVPGNNGYDGDATAFLGAPVYSTLRFYSDPSDPKGAQIDPGTLGHFHFFGAYPLTDPNGPVIDYYADTLSTDSNGKQTAVVFNPPTQPSGGIRPRTIPEPGTLVLGVLGLMGLLLRRRA